MRVAIVFACLLAAAFAAPNLEANTTSAVAPSSSASPTPSPSASTTSSPTSSTAPPAPTSSTAPPAPTSSTAPPAPSSSPTPAPTTTTTPAPAPTTTTTPAPPPTTTTTPAPPPTTTTTPAPAPTTTTTPGPAPSSSTAPPAPSSSTAPPAPSSSTAPPTPTPSPTPPSAGAYSLALYSVGACSLNAEESKVHILKMDASATCKMMPADLELGQVYYQLVVAGNTITTAKLICHDATCTTCDVVVSGSMLGDCVDNDGAKTSVRLNKNEATCVGGENAVAADIWAGIYQPVPSFNASCSKETSDIIDLVNLGPADGRCRNYTFQDSTQYGNVTDNKNGTWTVFFNCAMGCNSTTCDLSATNYKDGSCDTSAGTYGVSFITGSEVSSCNPAPQPNKKKAKGNTGAVAGAAIGAVAGVALVGFIYFRFIRRRNAAYTPIS